MKSLYDNGVYLKYGSSFSVSYHGVRFLIINIFALCLLICSNTYIKIVFIHNFSSKTVYKNKLSSNVDFSLHTTLKHWMRCCETGLRTFQAKRICSFSSFPVLAHQFLFQKVVNSKFSSYESSIFLQLIIHF